MKNLAGRILESLYLAPGRFLCVNARVTFSVLPHQLTKDGVCLQSPPIYRDSGGLSTQATSSKDGETVCGTLKLPSRAVCCPPDLKEMVVALHLASMTFSISSHVYCGVINCPVNF